MQFASFTFVFLFLPITMALYYLTPQRWKQEAGLGISLLFLCSGSWLAALVEILLAAAAYGAGLLLEKQRLRRGLSRLLLFGIIVLQFGALLILRSDWLRSWNTGLFSGKELFPLGLSFFVLQEHLQIQKRRRKPNEEILELYPKRRYIRNRASV